jgi:hypothetical protein
MAQQTINLGTVPNDGTGDPLRTAMDKVNDNFTELYGGGGTFTPAGTGAVARTIQAKLREHVFVEDFGAVGDNVANDRLAIQAAITAAAAAGGGVVHFQAKTYAVSGGTFYALSIADMSNVTLFGAGRELTKIRSANGSNVAPISLARANNITIRGITLDGNSDAQSQTGIHGIRCEDVDRLLLDDFGVINTMGYGIGLQDGTNTKIRIQNFYIANTRLDGTDFKNKDDLNDQIILENGVVENFGWAQDGSAGLDLRGAATINNVHIKMAYTGIGIRLRVDDIGNNGSGGKYTTISNVYIDGREIALTDGIIIDNEYCQVTNVTMKNVMKTGLWLTANANNCGMSNVTIKTTAASGQFVECSGNRNKFSNVSVIGNNNLGDAYRINGSENLFVNCSAVDTLRGFRTTSGTGRNSYVNCFCADVTTPYSSSALNFVINSPTFLVDQDLVAGDSVQAKVEALNGSQNYILLSGAPATADPAVSAAGVDTNIDLKLQPKGTGVVRFGGVTAITTETLTGFIFIKDASGAIRKLAVVS